MQLSALVAGLEPAVPLPKGAEAIDVTALTTDSRKAQPGTLFFALAGSKADGAHFIADAVARGAAAVVASQYTQVADPGVPVLRSANPRRDLARTAAVFYGTQPATTVAVTGTNGKTSVAEFTRQIFAALGRKSASLGTIGVVHPDGATYGSLTTPDPVALHETLAGLAHDGVTHLALEASSHGLDQHRLDGVRLAAAAFTNLGRDHLDYHPTVEIYLAAKMRLFNELLEPGQPAVVNLDGASSGDVAAAAQARRLNVLTVGREGGLLRLAEVRREGFAQRLTVRHAGASHEIDLPLIGTYQAENALVAAGLAIATGEDAEAVLGTLPGLQGVKGRLEVVGRARGGLAVIDYAHKPEALAAALEALRPFATGRLICVFGCGGDRDRGKRAVMGDISIQMADVTIVTDDNPRSEAPDAIRAEILAGAPGASEIGDREEAIRAAIGMLGAGDVVVIAGKGHETGQIVGDKVLAFSDHHAVERALHDLSGEASGA